MTLDEAVAPAPPLPADLTIPDLLDAAAWAHGTAPALRTMAGTALSHRELAEATRVLAAQLASTGVGPGVPVAALVDHDPAGVQAIIAIVRAGGCCFPLDPRWPAERCADLLTSLRVTRLVVGADYRPLGSEIAARVPDMGLVLATPGFPRPPAGGVLRPWDTLPRSAVIAPSPSDVAYVGASGRVRHQNLVDLLSWLNRSKETTHKDLALLAAPLALDVSLHDIFGTLAAGGSVLLLPDAQLSEPARLAQALVTREVTLWTTAVETFSGALAALALRPGSAGDRAWLRRVFLAGGPIPHDAFQDLQREFPNADLVLLGGE